LLGQFSCIAGLVHQLPGQDFDVCAGAQNVVASIVIPGLCQLGQGGQRNILDQQIFLDTTIDFCFQPLILVVQAIPGLL